MIPGHDASSAGGHPQTEAAPAVVREFISIIAAQAAAATAGHSQPGYLQLSRVHPTEDKLVCSRFQINDVEHMVAAAVGDSGNSFNAYVEGRTIKAGAPRGRGTLADTAAVFALVVDSDADKDMAWAPAVPVSMTIETSPGNYHYWLFLKEAVNAEVGKRMGERIRKATGADHDSGNPTQPYRIAGTTNYPSAAKIKRGRRIVPTRIIEFDPEVLFTPEDIERAFPLPERKTNEGDNGTATGLTNESGIPADSMAIIRDGVAKGGQSEAFWNVIIVLNRLGWQVGEIVELLERHPDGIARKYRGRLSHEVERAYNKIDGPSPQPRKPQRPPASTEKLMYKQFDPIKYVVPGLIVEGLTLIAGKPKIGKSWLLLHAGLAVSRGGFTLGDIHCIEGDVLYCALEDNERRLQSRLRVLLGSQPGPKRLHYLTELPRLGDGGHEVIADWIKCAMHPRLVAIDTLAMVREPKKRDESNYEADYNAVVTLRELANRHGVAVVLVHHLRKADADDAFDTVSGTLGLTGAPDSILVLKRDSSGTVILHGRGRDLPPVERVMTFNPEACTWTMGGDAADVRRSQERAAVLAAVEETDTPVGPRDIAAATGMKSTNVRCLLGQLVKEGAIEKASYGKYRGRRKAA
jgi:hypothetical protein